MEACVGYQIDLDYHYCSLYTAVENSCPSGYEFNEEENLAITLGDLKSKKGYYGYYGDYNSRCYGKINGKNIKHSVQSCYFLYYKI